MDRGVGVRKLGEKIISLAKKNFLRENNFISEKISLGEKHKNA